MGLVFKILLLFVVVFLDRGSCGVFVKTIRQKRALLPNVTSSRPTTFNHVYNIKLPHCKSCSPNISKPLARILEAQDEARDDKRFEHDVDPTNQVVFTHRINIPPQVCGCDDVQALLSRLESLEKQVATLRQQCSSNTCCGAKIDCGAHGTFSSSTCSCVCEAGWSGPTCAKASCLANCHPPQADCVAGRCVCREGFTGEDCSQEICPDNCNDQGRCIDEKCVCFPGYTGYGCTEEICPDDCRGRGRCVDGHCVCNKGYSGFDCSVEDCPGGCKGQGRCVKGKCICNVGFSGKDCSLQDCPANCHGQGNCVKGKCVCKKGFTGPDCGVKTCPQNCNDRGRCVNGKCVCNTGYSGPSCSIQACPDNCNKRGKCVNGKCVCNTGYSGPKCSVQDCPNNCNNQGRCTDGKCICKDGFTGNDCAIEIPAAIGLQVKKILETKVTVEWELPRVPVDAWEITFKPLKEDNGKLTKHLAGSKNSFQQTGLASGQEYQVTLRAQKGKKFGPAVSKTLRTLIDGPQNLHVVAATNSTIKLGWKKPQASIDLYRLNYSSATGKHSQVVVPAGDISAVLTGLEAGVEHNIFLVGEQGGHQSKAATTKGTTVIDSPRKLRVVKVMNSTISLEWEKSIARVGQYHITYRTEAGKGGELRVPGKDNTATLVGLENHTKYTISLVAEQGNMKSMPVTTVGTTEGLNQRKLAGSHSAPTVTAGENQFIQDISKAISRKIAAAKLSADVRTTARSIIRRYPAFAKNLLGSPKVQLVIPPARIQINSEKGQEAKKSKGGQGPVRTLVRPGRPIGPGRKLTGSPGIPPALRHRKGPVGSPSSNGTRKTSLDARRSGKGSESRLHTPEPTKQEILGGKNKTGNSGSSRLTSRIYLHPIGSLREPAVSRTSVTGSKETTNPLALNVTSSHIVLSWDIAEDLFDTLLLSYRDPSTNAVLSEMVLGGDQRMANITGLTIGKSYKVSLHGISGTNPSQPIHITRVAVSGPGEGPVGAHTDSTAFQTAPVETQGKGGEEEEDDDEEEDEEEKKEAEELGQEELELSAPLNAELGNAAISNVTSENLTQWWMPTVFNHSLVSTQNTTVSNASQIQETGDPWPFDLLGLTPNATHQAVTDDKLSAPLTDQVASFRNVTVRDITTKDFRLSWKVPEGAFDSFIIQYRVSSSSARWEERKVQGRFRSAVVKGLSAATEYTVRLYGVREGQRTGPFTLNVTTDSAEKVKPGDLGKLGRLTSSNITDSSIQLSWTAEKDFDTFLIHYRVDGSKDEQKLKLPGSLRSSIITGLRPNTKYTIYLYGVSFGQRTKPITTTVTTADKEAVKLGNLSISNITANSLRLSWTVNRAFDSFLIQYRVQGTEKTHNITVTGGRRSHVIVGLKPTTRYTVYIYGISAGLRTKPLTTDITTKAEERPQQIELSDFSVTNIAANSLQLSWVTKRKYDSFLVEYGVKGDRDMLNFTATGDRRSSIITGLRPTTTYTFYLYGLSAGQRTRPLTAVATTTASTDKVKIKPSKVIKLENLSVSNITADSFQLSWGAEKNFDSFLIQYGVRGSRDVQNLTVTGDRRLSLITGLRPTTVYTVTIYGISGGVRTKPLNIVTTTKGKPSKIIKLSASNITADSVRLSWSPQKDIDFFIIQYRVLGSAVLHNVTITGDRRSYIITGLKPATKYLFSLYSVFRQQHLKSLTLTVTTKGRAEPKPSKLGDLSISNVTSDSIPLSWTAEKGFDTFLIRYKMHGFDSVQNFTVTGDNRLTTITGLRPSTKYTVYVYGVYNGKRTKALSRVVTTKASTDKEAVKLGSLSTSNLTANSLRLSWIVDRAFDSFLIQYRIPGSEETRNITVTGGQRSHLIVGLKPTTRYTIYIYGIFNGKRTKPLTTTVTTTASATVKPSKLGDISVSHITTQSFKLSWMASKGFDSFLIQYSSAAEPRQVHNLTVAGDQRSFFVKGLRPTTVYTVRLYGVTKDQRTKPLTTVVTTAAIPIHTVGFSTLGRLSVSDIDTHSLKLTWTVEEGAFDSFLVQYRDSQGRLGTKEVTVPGNLRHVVITDLRPGTEYLISLYGVLKNQQTEPIPIMARTARESRSRLRFTDLRDTSVTVHWEAPSTPVDSFKVFYVPTKRGEPKSVITDGRKTNVTLRGLVPNSQYEVNLVATQRSVESSPIVDHFTTAPDAPAALKAVNISETMALLTWKPAIAPVDHYIITYSGPAVATVSRNVPGNSAELQLTGLRVNTQYTAEIYSVKGDRKSPRISTSFVTDSDLPRDLTARDISLTEALISWKSPRGPVTGYLLVYGTEGGKTERVKLDRTVTSHRLRQLLPSTRYTVSLHALRDGERTAAITADFTTVSANIPFPKDCGEEYSNGRRDSSIVTLYLGGNKDKPFKVYCDMTTNGGGWLVFQRRMNGKINFMRNWKAYSNGFGALTGEHWLGLQYLHQLTSQQRYELLVDLRNGNESAYAIYDNFVVESLAQRYRLKVGKYSGNAGDSLSYHHGSNFTTLDSDNDEALTNCAVSYRGGWWYKNCHRVNLNGEYGNNRDHQGVNWYGWKGFEFSIPFTEMKMRPYKFARGTVRKA